MTRRVLGSLGALGCVLAASSAALAQRAWTTPGEAEAGQARALAAEGRCADALAPFDTAITQRSEDASLRRDRGACHDTLGNTAPALADYREYLTRVPSAPDAARVQARIQALEAADTAERPPEPAAPAPGPGEPGATAAPPRRANHGRSGAYLLGLEFGGRQWSDRGYADPTGGAGLAGGYRLGEEFELSGRLLLLRTDGPDASGFGLAAGGLYRLPLVASGELELGLGLSVGVERQSDPFDTTTTYWVVRAEPTLRWAPHEEVMLLAGPDLGFGPLSGSSTIAAVEGGTTDFVSHLGLRVAALWLIGGR